MQGQWREPLKIGVAYRKLVGEKKWRNRRSTLGHNALVRVIIKILNLLMYEVMRSSYRIIAKMTTDMNHKGMEFTTLWV